MQNFTGGRGNLFYEWMEVRASMVLQVGLFIRDHMKLQTTKLLAWIFQGDEVGSKAMSIFKNFRNRKASPAKTVDHTRGKVDADDSHNKQNSMPGADSPIVLELDQATVELAGQTILQKVSLKVARGETLVIIGPSGGGKTVLLKTLAGLFTPNYGQALCMGIPWKNRDQVSKHQLASKIGMQFQRSALFDELTAYENIEFVLKEHTQLDASARETRILDCLRAVGLEKYRDYREHQLSGGMKQRVGIARSIAVEPEILFMDDPTAGLDPINADDMAKLVIGLKRRIGATLVIVTHDISRAFQFAEENGRIVLVAQKAVRETGTAEETRFSTDPLVQQFIHGMQKGPLIPE